LVAWLNANAGLCAKKKQNENPRAIPIAKPAVVVVMVVGGVGRG
jgi:hypothetical protein